MATRMKRGFTTNFDSTVAKEMRCLSKPRTFINVTWAFMYLISIPATAVMAAIVITSPPSTVPIILISYLLAVTFIARQQRGLEAMVHDASHGNWHRRRQHGSTSYLNLLIGYPVLNRLSSYWDSHRVHHAQYGSHLDPCRRRFRMMGLGHLDLSTRWKIVKAVVQWLPSYNATYYKEIGSFSLDIWIRFVMWHTVAFIIPSVSALTLLAGFSFPHSVVFAILGWVAFWLVPAVVVLPILRSIAEAEEHDYDIGDSEFDTTFTNIGLVHRLWFHPFYDSYHLVHHMFPAIPAVNHHKVHVLLTRNDSSYRYSLRRTKVLGQDSPSEKPDELSSYNGQGATINS